LFREKNHIYSENHTRHFNIFCGQNEEYFNVKVGGTHSNQCVLNGKGTARIFFSVYSPHTPLTNVPALKRDQGSHPCKIKVKNYNLYVLICKILVGKRKDKIVWI
jgi:hypothetical protein